MECKIDKVLSLKTFHEVIFQKKFCSAKSFLLAAGVAQVRFRNDGSCNSSSVFSTGKAPQRALYHVGRCTETQERFSFIFLTFFICKLRNVCCCTLELNEVRFSVIFDCQTFVYSVKSIPIYHISPLVLHFLSFQTSDAWLEI